MTTPTPRTLHLSASAVSAYKACPTRFRLGYIEGLRLIEDTESQRVGNNWHKLHEIYRDGQRILLNQEYGGVVIPMQNKVDPFQAAMDWLNQWYSRIPDSKTPEEWATERVILATCFAAHCWYYQNETLETLATEISFRKPLYHPKTRLPLNLDEVLVPGKIDRLIRYNRHISVGDYKSTTKSIDSDSIFWNHLRLDTQINLYVDAAQWMQKKGLLVEYGIDPSEPVAGAFYDVWHRPTIKPSKLTQAETAEFFKTGKYCNTDFKVGLDGENNQVLTVNGELAEYFPGAKEGKGAIRETSEMYGARLLADIYERPTFYFARREIPCTDEDTRRFQSQIYSIYQSMKTMRDTGHWFQCEHSCNATFPCAYIPICFHGVDVTAGQTPAGFRRIFADLTKEGETVEL